MPLKSCPLFLFLLFLSNLINSPTQAQAASALQIVIVEGDGAINNVRERLNREVIVQVDDENRKPVAGAAVVFFLPSGGPGGTFANGTNSLITTTDAQGRAVARGIRFNDQAGSMQIRVTASFAGLTASAIVTQSNVLSGASTGAGIASGGMHLSTKLLIIGAVVAAGVATGVYFGNRGGSSPGAPPAIILTPGNPNVGGP